jgi:hypothetical protein
VIQQEQFFDRINRMDMISKPDLAASRGSAKASEPAARKIKFLRQD